MFCKVYPGSIKDIYGGHRELGELGRLHCCQMAEFTAIFHECGGTERLKLEFND